MSEEPKPRRNWPLILVLIVTFLVFAGRLRAAGPLEAIVAALLTFVLFYVLPALIARMLRK